jgi:hypothetical protein
MQQGSGVNKLYGCSQLMMTITRIIQQLRAGQGKHWPHSFAAAGN